MNRKSLIASVVVTALALLALLAYSLERTAWLFGLFEKSEDLAFTAAIVVELFERAAYYGCFIALSLYLTDRVGFTDVETGWVIALFAASLVGVYSTIVFDAIRVRQMYAFQDKHLNRLNYSNALDVVYKAVTHEGPFTFMAGGWPYFFKLYIYGLSVS